MLPVILSRVQSQAGHQLVDQCALSASFEQPQDRQQDVSGAAAAGWAGVEMDSW
jgi:hypothetical protein